MNTKNTLNIRLTQKTKMRLSQRAILFVVASLTFSLIAGFIFFAYINTATVHDAKAAGIPVIINGYARVTGISGNTLTVNTGTVSEVAGTGTFAAGGRAILIQMQDAVIGTTSNTVNFGNVGASILSAGLYEIITISSVARNGGGNLTSVSYSGTLSNSYSTGGNSRLQLVTFPTLNDGSGNYTTTADITALNWNGSVGGVVAFNVSKTLSLLHDIYADGKGFVGGSANGGGSAGCTSGTYISAAGNNYANKGEGIYRNTDNNWIAARGKVLNGGGGGNSHNAGGGGGGNYSAGGDGGPGWQGSAPGYCSPSAGGIGGIALSTFISPSRVFMGGGGGAGEGNDGGATPGANGGGIIFISAQTLFTDGSCTGFRISANGDAANDTSAPADNDGAGGGGAGGSILLDIDNYAINSVCPLTIQANGGDGGSVNDAGTHGGGGGGGMGVIMLSVAAPINNVYTSTDPGTGGSNDSSGSFVASPGGGSAGAGEGVSDNSNLTLPVELIDFRGYSEDSHVYLTWVTASEINNDYFDVELSRDGKTFVNIGQVDGYGTTKEKQTYEFKHFNQFTGINYYRLKQVDFDGQFEYSKVIFVDHVNDNNQLVVNVFPNPSKGADITVRIFSKSKEDIAIGVYNSSGEMVINELISAPAFGELEYTIAHELLTNGMYTVKVRQGQNQDYKKLMVN